MAVPAAHTAIDCSQGRLPCYAQRHTKLTQALVARAVAPVATQHSFALHSTRSDPASRWGITAAQLPRSATCTGKVGKQHVRQEHYRIPLKGKGGELQTLSQGCGHSSQAEALLRNSPVSGHHWSQAWSSPLHDWGSCGDPHTGDPRCSEKRRRLKVPRGRRGGGEGGAGGGGRRTLAGPRAPSPAACEEGRYATSFPREDAPKSQNSSLLLCQEGGCELHEVKHPSLIPSWRGNIASLSCCALPLC